MPLAFVSLHNGAMALATSVTMNYLKVIGIPLREGRFLDDRNRYDSTPVIVIDKVLARNAFGGRSAVAQRLWVPDFGKTPFEVSASSNTCATGDSGATTGRRFADKRDLRNSATAGPAFCKPDSPFARIASAQKSTEHQ